MENNSFYFNQVLIRINSWQTISEHQLLSERSVYANILLWQLPPLDAIYLYVEYCSVAW